MSTQVRSYLFALIDGGGTVPPELGVVQRLVARGHRVVVLGEDSMRDDVRQTGAQFERWSSGPNRPGRRPEDDFLRDWECKTPLQMFDRVLDRQLIGPAMHYAADVRAQIARERPALIVCSMFAFGAMAAAEAEGIPFDVLFSNIYVLPAEGMPPMSFGLLPARGVFGRLRDRLLSAFSARIWNRGLARFNTLRASLTLPPLAALLDQPRAARRQLVLTSREFDFPARLPASVRYVGPVLDDPAWASAELSLPAGDAPLVLVSLSTTFQEQHGCLQRIVDALGTLPVRGIVTTGPAIKPSSLRAPSNVTIVAAASHACLLREAAVMVTHGGHGTVVRSLAAGVPLAIFHHGRDQADNAARVTSRGAGLEVSRRASSARVAKVITRLIRDQSYRANARRLGDAIVRDAASSALIDELEDLPEPVSHGAPRPLARCG